MAFQDDLYKRLDEFASSPFLFIGSGFSRRYLNAEDWQGLLRKYSTELGTEFERYRSLANGDWPQVGKLIANDYHKYWFDSGKKEDEKALHLQDIVNYSSPLKVSISRHLASLSEKGAPPEIQQELELFKSAKVNGIITTNYDSLCERVFPDFKVYKSQGELIFSTIQEVGEIYKIHGCCTEPNSLVFTTDDYAQFNERNAYLAAKLLTVFLEHPTIFMGYSLTDNNIRTILSSIIRCLDQAQVNELSERLFFVQYEGARVGEPVIDKYEFEIGGSILPLTRIRANGFIEIIQVLSGLSQKFPAGLLRRMKEHIYELISTNDPTGKIEVVDFDADSDLDKVDVVIGIGVGKNSEKSYETFSRFDIAEDILYSNKQFDNKELLAKTLPKLVKATSWIPVFKYFQASKDKDKIDPKVLTAVTRPLDDWKNGNPYAYKAPSINKELGSIDNILKVAEPSVAVKMILLLEPETLDLDLLQTFLIANFDLTKDQQNSSYFMKLVCLYDRLRYSK